MVDKTTETVETVETEVVEAEQSRTEAIETGLNEATVDAALEQLADKEGELTPADLREALGDEAKGMTDEQLIAEWNKALEAEGVGDEKKAEAPVFKLDFPLYDDKGGKVEDVSKVTLQDFLSGKYKIGYTAMGKEVQKNLSELRRVASLGHYNEHQMNTLRNERGQIYDKYTKLSKEQEKWSADRTAWASVLTQAAMGNVAPLQKMVDEFAAGNGGAVASPETEQDDPMQSQAGQTWVLENVVPVAQTLANEYGANATEITQEFLRLVDAEPAELLTEQKLKMILEYEIPARLEQAGYVRGGKPVTQTENTEVAELKKKLAEYETKEKNAATQRIRTRKAPPKGAGVGSGGNEGGVPMHKIKTRADMKAYLRGEMDDE